MHSLTLKNCSALKMLKKKLPFKNRSFTEIGVYSFRSKSANPPLRRYGYHTGIRKEHGTTTPACTYVAEKNAPFVDVVSRFQESTLIEFDSMCAYAMKR